MSTSHEVEPGAVTGVPANPSDHSLLRRWRSHDEDAATQLYLRYAQRLRALVLTHRSDELARRVEVDDLVQSTFGSFFRGINRGYYDVPAGEEVWKLILVIALNKLRAQGNFQRAAKRDVRLTVGGNALGREPQRVTDGEASALNVLKLVIDEVLERVPASHRTIIALRVEGYEVAEIASQSRRSKRTVERVLQEFRRRLAEAIS